MKFSFYIYISNINTRIVANIEKIAVKKNWLIYIMFYCSVVSLFFAFPSFDAWDASSGRLHSFLLQCESITEFWKENKISNVNYRITVPLLVGLLGGGHTTSIIIRFIVGILLFGLCAKIIYDYTKDRTSAILFSITLALTNPGATSFCEHRGMFDGIAIFLVMLPFYFKNHFLIIFTILLAFFTDERTLVSTGFLLTHGMLNSEKGLGIIRRIFNNYNLSILTGLIIYIFIRYQINVAYSLGLQEVNQLKYGWKFLNQFNNVPVAIWTGLEGFWIVILLNIILLYKNQNFFSGLIFISTIIFLIIMGNSVGDTSRSMLYLFPAVIVGMKQISKKIPNNETRNILILCLIISFIFPSYWVGAKSSIWWQYPMPIQIIRWTFLL